MEKNRRPASRKNGFRTVKANVKDIELVRKKQLHIAKKATKLFIKKGFHGTSMREISRATGMATGVLYGYIKKKEDVLSLVFELSHDIWAEFLEEQGVFEIEDPEEQLKTVLHKLLEVQSDWKDEVLLMYRESKFLTKEALRDALEGESKLTSRVEEIIRKGMNKKVFKVKDPFFEANALLLELVLNPLRGWNLKRYTEEERTGLLIDHIMKALL